MIYSFVIEGLCTNYLIIIMLKWSNFNKQINKITVNIIHDLKLPTCFGLSDLHQGVFVQNDKIALLT